jgi:vacuolar-type H+-ATPase subunit I/STV1
MLYFNKVKRPKKVKEGSPERPWGPSKVDKSLFEPFNKQIEKLMSAGANLEYFKRVQYHAQYHFDNNSTDPAIAAELAAISGYSMDIIDVKREMRKIAHKNEERAIAEREAAEQALKEKKEAAEKAASDFEKSVIEKLDNNKASSDNPPSKAEKNE